MIYWQLPTTYSRRVSGIRPFNLLCEKFKAWILCKLPICGGIVPLDKSNPHMYLKILPLYCSNLFLVMKFTSISHFEYLSSWLILQNINLNEEHTFKSSLVDSYELLDSFEIPNDMLPKHEGIDPLNLLLERSTILISLNPQTCLGITIIIYYPNFINWNKQV